MNLLHLSLIHISSKNKAVSAGPEEFRVRFFITTHFGRNLPMRLDKYLKISRLIKRRTVCLLYTSTQQLSNMKIFIHALNSRQERGSNNAFISATISISGLPQLQNIIERLSKIPGVLSIDRS